MPSLSSEEKPLTPSRTPRARFAPSPTGHLHVGGARTALFNWLFARHHGGVFVLRIEDTDQERSSEEMTRAIFEGLRWLGLDWDEGPGVGGPHAPYVQTERRDLYQTYARQLLDAGRAYPCFCTPEELRDRRKAAEEAGRTPGYDGRCRDLAPDEAARRTAAGEPRALRFRTPPGVTRFEDRVKGTVTFDNANLEDFVILKSDGHPTYNFGAAIDDLTMEITHVIRGDDHVSNTPRQILLYRALDATPPEFAHLSMILGPDGARLSKRHGATSVESYREMGFLPETLVNFLALLGWSYDGKTEIFSREDLVRLFSLDRVGSTASIFDVAKLEWMNGEYLKALPVSARANLVLEHLITAGRLTRDSVDRAWLERIVAAVGDRLKRVPQILEYAGYLFDEDVTFDETALKEMVARPRVREIFERLRETLAGVDPFDEPSLEAAVRGLASSMVLKAGDVIHPTRVALTGKKVSPGIFEVMALLGRERVLDRLEGALDRVQNEGNRSSVRTELLP